MTKDSFKNALSGLRAAFKHEKNLKIHGLLALLVVNCGFYFHISKTEWCVILFCIALVISLELLNSSIEKICDFIQPQNDLRIKYIKDVAASAVLIAAIVSFILGIIIFYPHIFN